VNEERLPNCNCANCQRWVAQVAVPPRVMSIAESCSWHNAYKSRRRHYRTDNPNLTRDDLVLVVTDDEK
jgi:hypothetical protein